MFAVLVSAVFSRLVQEVLHSHTSTRKLMISSTKVVPSNSMVGSLFQEVFEQGVAEPQIVPICALLRVIRAMASICAANWLRQSVEQK